MNAQLQESTAIAVIPPKPPTVTERALSVFAAVPDEESLRELAKKSVTITEITNEAGKDQCHASRMVLKNTRLEIQRVGEEGREDAVQTSKAIIARQKALIGITQPEEDRLQAIQDAWDAKIEAEKEAKIQTEISRVAHLQERVTELRGSQTLSPANGSQLILEHIADLEGIAVDASFEEFEQQASDAKTAALVRLNGILGAAVAHEAEQAKIIADRAELARLREEEEKRQAKARAEQAERDRLAAEAQAKADATAKIERERLAKEENDKRVAEAREHAEQIQKDRERIAAEEAASKAVRDAEEKRLADERAEQEAADKANRQRNEMALQEIQSIHHQLVIADIGRAPYCKGGDLESIDFAIDGTDKWILTEARFGALFSAAVKTKETTLEALRQKRSDFITRQENAVEAKRLADQQAAIDRQQAALVESQKPKPEISAPSGVPATTIKSRIVERPTAAQLIALVSGHYGVSLEMAAKWIRHAKVEIEAAT